MWAGEHQSGCIGPVCRLVGSGCCCSKGLDVRMVVPTNCSYEWHCKWCVFVLHVVVRVHSVVGVSNLCMVVVVHGTAVVLAGDMTVGVAGRYRGSLCCTAVCSTEV